MPRVSGTTPSTRAGSAKVEAVVDGDETLDTGMGLVICNFPGWYAQHVEHLPLPIEGIEHAIPGSQAFQREHFYAPQAFASLVHRDDFPHGVVGGTVLAEPVFRECLEQGRIRPGLLKEGQDGAVIRMLTTALDALEVICCIAMDGKSRHDTLYGIDEQELDHC